MPVFEGSVATVLDYSSLLLVFQLEGRRIRGSMRLPINPEYVEKFIQILKGAWVRVLICGAVSSVLAEAIKGREIELITCVRGKVDQVIAAYLRGELAAQRFRLPGTAPTNRR